MTISKREHLITQSICLDLKEEDETEEEKEILKNNTQEGSSSSRET